MEKSFFVKVAIIYIFLQHTNSFGQGALNSTESSKYQLGVNYYLGVYSFKLNSSFKKLNSVFPSANLQVP